MNLGRGGHNSTHYTSSYIIFQKGECDSQPYDFKCKVIFGMVCFSALMPGERAVLTWLVGAQAL